jgi:hypothetical protein
MTHHICRVLGLDPTTRGFAYALLEAPHDLIDWGMCDIPVRTDIRVLERVGNILDQLAPDILILEDGRGSRRRKRARRVIRKAAVLAQRRGLIVVHVSRAKVRKYFAPAGGDRLVTKQDIAEQIATIFPELVPRLPRRRTACWIAEDRRMSIFDALSFALTAISDRI